MRKRFLGVAAGVFILVSLVSYRACADDDVICEEAYRDFCGEYEATEDAPAMARCLEEKFDQLPLACQPAARSELEQYKKMIEPCRENVKGRCGYDLGKVVPKKQEEAQELFQCLIINWDQLDEGCQEHVRRSVPFFAVIEEGLVDQDLSAYKKRGGGKKVEVKGARGKVRAVEQEGDVIWYKAKLIDREVVESYPFCPEVEDEGLELEVHELGYGCSYRVMDEVPQRIINELKANNVLKKISYLGVRGVPNTAKDQTITDVLTKYASRCPDGFQLDVYNDEFRNEQRVYCKSIEKQYCDTLHGWVNSYPKEGMYGCKKMAQCVDMDEAYEDFGHRKLCGYCYAGGCVDPSRTHNYHTNPLVYCKVNTANPELTECAE